MLWYITPEFNEPVIPELPNSNLSPNAIRRHTDPSLWVRNSDITFHFNHLGNLNIYIYNLRIVPNFDSPYRLFAPRNSDITLRIRRPPRKPPMPKLLRSSEKPFPRAVAARRSYFRHSAKGWGVTYRSGLNPLEICRDPPRMAKHHYIRELSALSMSRSTSKNSQCLDPIALVARRSDRI